jgi:hypothetical protein
MTYFMYGSANAGYSDWNCCRERWYVPTRCGVAKGIPAARLVTLAARDGLERVGHGLYRIPNFRLTLTTS